MVLQLAVQKSAGDQRQRRTFIHFLRFSISSIGLSMRYSEVLKNGDLQDAALGLLGFHCERHRFCPSIKQVSIAPLPQKSRTKRLGVMHIISTSETLPSFHRCSRGAAALAVSVASSDGPTTHEELISTSARTVNFPRLKSKKKSRTSTGEW